MKRDAKRRVGLAAAGCLLLIGLAAYALVGNNYAKEVEKEAAAVKLLREVQQGRYHIITTGELKDLIDSGKEVLIIDAMPYKAYKKAHIPDARQFLFPIPEMTAWDTEKTGGKTRKDFEKLLGADKNRTIIVYCGFVKCSRSHNGAMWARKLGYQNVFRYPGGIFAWRGAEYPTRKAE